MTKTTTILTKSLNLAKIEVTELAIKDSPFGLLFRKLILGKSDSKIVKSRATRIVIAASWTQIWTEADVMEVDDYFREFVPPSCLVLIQSSLDSVESDEQQRSKGIHSRY